VQLFYQSNFPLLDRTPNAWDQKETSGWQAGTAWLPAQPRDGHSTPQHPNSQPHVWAPVLPVSPSSKTTASVFPSFPFSSRMRRCRMSTLRCRTCDKAAAWNCLFSQFFCYDASPSFWVSTNDSVSNTQPCWAGSWAKSASSRQLRAKKGWTILLLFQKGKPRRSWKPRESCVNSFPHCEHF